MVNEGHEWKYTPEEQPEDDMSSGDNSHPSKTKEKAIEAFSWTSTTSPVGKKKFTWYIYLLILTLGVSALVLLLTKDKISTLVVLVCGIIFCIYGIKKPRNVEYRISDVGFTIGAKQYSFASFKSFYILGTNDHYTVALTPLKRFMPYMYINYSKKEENKIAPILGKKLPLEKTKGDLVERFIRYIGF